MPYYVNYAVISGQSYASEIVVAASTMLFMDSQSITPISADNNVRKEFLLALEAFSCRERHPIYSSKREQLAEGIIKPNNAASKNNEFWIALDDQGYSLAKEFFSVHGDLPEQPVYKSIRKLNLIQPATAPPPQIKTSPEFWTNIIGEISLLTYKQYAVVSKENYQAFINRYVPMTPIEKEYYSWFKSFYESLLPWKESIRELQSAWS